MLNILQKLSCCFGGNVTAHRNNNNSNGIIGDSIRRHSADNSIHSGDSAHSRPPVNLVASAVPVRSGGSNGSDGSNGSNGSINSYDSGASTSNAQFSELLREAKALKDDKGAKFSDKEKRGVLKFVDRKRLLVPRQIKEEQSEKSDSDNALSLA